MSEVDNLFTAQVLRKATYTKLGSLHTDATGVTCIVKVISGITTIQVLQANGTPTTFYEFTCGDETAQCVISVQDVEPQGISLGQVVCVRNASVRIVKGYMKLVVDKWGK